MRFLVGERIERDGCDIRSANERDPPVICSGIDLGLVLDRS